MGAERKPQRAPDQDQQESGHMALPTPAKQVKCLEDSQCLKCRGKGHSAAEYIQGKKPDPEDATMSPGEANWKSEEGCHISPATGKLVR